MDSSRDRVTSSPRARALARQNGIDLENVKGSGPGGRITTRDVAQYLEQLTAPETEQTPNKIETAASPGVTASSPAPGAGRFLSLMVECRIDELLRTRDRVNMIRKPDEGPELTLAAFYWKAFASALYHYAPGPEQPGAVELTADDAKIAFATLTTSPPHWPVVPSKAQTPLSDFAAALANPNATANAGPDGLGSDFILLDLSAYRMRQGSANLPGALDQSTQSAVTLTLGASERRPVVTGERLSIATVIACTLTFDLQRFPPETAAAALDAFRGLIELPESLVD